MIKTIFAQITLSMWLMFALVVMIFIVWIIINMLNKTVGFKFAKTLYTVKKLGKNKILLRILVPNGVPEFKIVDIAPRMEYEFKENGQTKQGMVIFDHKCVYEMFAGFKVIDCRTDDVFPVNPYASTSLTISPERFKKNAVDSANDDFKNREIKKWIKYAIPLLIIFGAILILYSSNQSETLAICYEQVRSLSSQLANLQPATIIAQ